MITLSHIRLILPSLRICATVLITSFGISVYAQNDLIGLISPASGTYEGQDLTIDYHTGSWTVLNMDNSNGQIGNGIFNERYLVTSVNDQENNAVQFRLYPNPTTKWLTINTSKSSTQPSHFSILNNSGKEVLKNEWPESVTAQTIDLSQLSAELYILILHSKDEKPLASYKLIKID